VRRGIPWGIIFVLLLWCLLSFGRIMDPLYLPTPLQVFEEIGKSTRTGQLPMNIGATVYRLIIGFAIGSFVGVPVGLVMGYSRRVYDALEILIEVVRSIPVVALFPLFLILFGLGDQSKIGLAAWSSALVILINTMYGVRHGSSIRRMAARSLKANEWQVFWKVGLPDAFPEILVGLRTGVSIALIVVLMTEMFLGTTRGVGQMIYNAQIMYDTPTVFVGVLAAGLTGFSVNMVLLLVERRIVHWKIK
jgi:ABC-type nitrate/sulfonate/bicarbonate transport system permease component